MNWKYKVNIKKYLSDGEDVAAIQRAYDGIVKELEILPFPYPQAFDRFSKIALEQEDVEIFNLGMNHLYDWADSRGIWLG